MARGKVRKNQQQQNSRGQHGGAGNQKNCMAAKVEAAIVDQLRPGRHPCRCQARIHSLVRNCMGCGKIVCMQEGSGPCFFCGTLVCTKEEQEILDRGSRKSVELYNQLMGESSKGSDGTSAVSLSSIGGDLERATAFRDKLLSADADSERRTRVNDLECDYSSLENNPFLTADEREAIMHRREELKNIREQRKKAIVINLNLSNASIDIEKTKLYDIDPANDPIIQGILDKSESRRKSADLAHSSTVESECIFKEFVPKYDQTYGKRFSSNVEEFADLDNISLLNNEIMQLEVERKGYALALLQPAANCVAYGSVKCIRWKDDLMLRGPVFITSSVRPTNTDEITKFIDTYCREHPSTRSIMDYSPGSILGRVFIEECLTIDEFQKEFGMVKVYGSGDFVILFSSCEPLTTPIPHIPSADFYQIDKEFRSILADVFRN